MKHKDPNEVANKIIRVSLKVKNHLIKNSIKILNSKGEEVDESISQTAERLMGLE